MFSLVMFGHVCTGVSRTRNIHVFMSFSTMLLSSEWRFVDCLSLIIDKSIFAVGLVYTMDMFVHAKFATTTLLLSKRVILFHRAFVIAV